ncbi:MAG: biotin/lipoyl-containing protein [Gemmatimonadota bacterium]
MKYIVDVDGERREVSLEGDAVVLEGQRVRAHLADVEGTPIRVVSVGTEVHRVAAVRGATKGSYILWVDGYRFQVEALDERTRAIRDMTAESERDPGPRPLTAPMPGLIVRVNVREGDQVQTGQGLVVMEAMKMENELRSVSAGRVRSVSAVPGSAVEKGAVLVELE